MNSDNVIEALKVAVDNRALTPEVLGLLLPDGRPFDCEGQLWDYKAHAPSMQDQPSEAEKAEHRISIAEIVKDAVAFYNAFGGYILFGVKDKGRDRIVGISDGFNCADLNKALHSYAGISIECLYHTLRYPAPNGRISLGLLLIPRRPAGAPPVKLVRKGPEKPNGKRAFLEEVYVRVRDECRAATNTHEDWLFLHSDRLPPEQVAGAASVAVQAHLPARDTDLLEFVGREEQLAELRRWIGDDRSPVRLITGIGGLGKTTLAYRFAEEVIETGAGEVETVIWLTAKQQTYSALRGKMVPISRVDFNDLSSLFNAILKALSHEMPLSEEEPSFTEVGDRLVEALSTIPSLVVVDDLDTLSPDEQKETVAALNSVALRTVGRELPPSRMLMTSRIDQGLPPTAIVKILGLKRTDFEVHLANLCGAFTVEPFVGRDLDEIFEASSGSPLFAASIVRLLKLGENRRDVVEKWKGRDGEEVRNFAFQRELERLTAMEARVLYAVLLLGETTLADIAEVVDMQHRAVRDQVAGLQAYHLMATASKGRGDSTISVPDELQSVVDLVRTQLGAGAKLIEEAVGRAHERSGNQERQVGASIRSIVRLWSAERFDEAVIVASDLRKKFPANGDAASILGASLLRTRPPRYREADRELDAAAKLGCTKSELLPNIIRAKTQTEDWIGLREITRTRISNEPNGDIALAAHLRANGEMISAAKVRGDRDRIAELAIEAVERITAKLRRTRLDVGYFNSLLGQRFDFARAYVDALDRSNTRGGDRVRVFEGVARLAAADVVVIDLLERGVSALEEWWGDVERRPVADLAACKLLSRMLGKLEKIEQQLAGYKRDTGATSDIETRRRELEYRGAALQTSIG
ncbi:RNA-binding domain-containing protein [Sphingosinicella sp. CPCC 101087]|uniref:RNA-binding domain-containing protein n=1 Tax=Sphingosinicella sp. CPCC 101087 TaxID=2497754 RepID=UPI00101D5C7F|nr:RNA-binding domain-containing protein [Sphingosinicella sp. CPCC 101087]